jgi:hypothetical protein
MYSRSFWLIKDFIFGAYLSQFIPIVIRLTDILELQNEIKAQSNIFLTKPLFLMV